MRKTKPPIAHRLQAEAKAAVASEHRANVIPRRLRRRGVSRSSASSDLEIPPVASAPLGMTTGAGASNAKRTHRLSRSHPRNTKPPREHLAQLLDASSLTAGA